MKEKKIIVTKFDLKDFEGSGQYVLRNNLEEITQDGYLCSVAYKIGYIPDENNHYCLVAVSDGYIIEVGEKQELVDYLNEKAYRFATKDEIIRCINHTGDFRFK